MSPKSPSNNLTQDARRRRRANVIDAIAGGMTASDAAKKFGVGRAYAQQLARNARPRHDEAHAKWLEWQKSHVLLCNNYPHGKCSKPHTLHDLHDFHLPGGKVAYVCMGKAYENQAALRTTTQRLEARQHGRTSTQEPLQRLSGESSV